VAVEGKKTAYHARLRSSRVIWLDLSAKNSHEMVAFGAKGCWLSEKGRKYVEMPLRNVTGPMMTQERERHEIFQP
jgi:hypothetical protein